MQPLNNILSVTFSYDSVFFRKKLTIFIFVTVVQHTIVDDILNYPRKLLSNDNLQLLALILPLIFPSKTNYNRMISPKYSSTVSFC